MNILFLGCGSIGRKHIQNISKKYDYTLFAYDPNPQMLQRVKEDVQVETYNDIDKALYTRPDAVFISVPTSLHLETALKAACFTKNIFLEKPLSHQLEGIEALKKTVKEKNIVLMVACNMRFHPAIKKLYEYLPKLGKIYFSRALYGYYLPYMRKNTDYRTVYAAHRSMGGGVILDAIHEIDYHHWFFGEPVAVNCVASRQSDLEIDVEDYANIVITYQNGVRSEIHLDYLQRYKRRGCEIIGEAGTLIWESLGKNPEECTVRFYDDKKSRWEVLFDSKGIDDDLCFQEEMESFFNAAFNEKPLISDVYSGERALRTTLDALKGFK
jgi:predicted dehydrogenase